MPGIQLPPILAKVVKIFGVLGMSIGVWIAIDNHYENELGKGILIIVGMGLVFAWAAKYFIGRWMFYWMETKLEVAAKEKEEAKNLEAARREERRRKAEEESAKIRAEVAAAKASQQQAKPTGT
jgi:hypothetical protein